MNRKILVIDDEEVIRKSFILTLEDSGYSVSTAESGKIGVDLLQSNTFNLVFLDLKMPGMNGVETLREIRKLEPDIPVYIITAFHEEYLGQLSQCVDDNIEFELLRKPVGSEQILAVTQSILDGPLAY